MAERKDVETSVDVRTYLAAERTLLAWIRTGLAMMGFGFVVARFGLFMRELAAVREVVERPSHSASMWVGTTLVVLGVLVSLAAAAKHWRMVRRMMQHQTIGLQPLSLAIAVAVILGIVGSLMAVYLAMEMRW
jgi:putative membrane protein